MPCESSCEPSQPCHAPGCLNAPPPTHEPEHSEIPISSPEPDPDAADPQDSGNGSGDNRHAGDQSWSSADGTVRIGVGNRSATDVEIEICDNLVVGGSQRAHIGSGNTAARHNTGRISGNLADCDDLVLGVNNYSAGGDNHINIHDNDFRGGFRSVHVGAANHAGGSNRIFVAGLLPTPFGGPRHPEGPYPYSNRGPEHGGGWGGHGGPPGAPPGLVVGVGNVARHGDNELQVRSGAITWTPGVQIGCNNRAGGSNKIIIG